MRGWLDSPDYAAQTKHSPKPMIFHDYCRGGSEVPKPGILLLFNIELITFLSRDQFADSLEPVCQGEKVTRIVLVLPPRKINRLLGYIKDYRDEFESTANVRKFEVAAVLRRYGVSAALSFRYIPLR